MQNHIQNTTHHFIPPSHSSGSHNNLYCFLGGFLINICYIKVNLPDVLNYVTSIDFIIFLIRSTFGGLVPLGIKLLYDYYKKKQAQKKGGTNG